MEILSSQLVIFKLSTLGKMGGLFMLCSVNMCKMWSVKKDLLKGKFMCFQRGRIVAHECKMRRSWKS